jgi:hypothetical protein
MSPPRIVTALLGAAVSASVCAGQPAASTQPEFVPLRGKNPDKSASVEKPAPAPRLGTRIRTEMSASIGPDGKMTLQCNDASHQHAAAPQPQQETE